MTKKKSKKKPKKENAVVRYLRETRVELGNVHWPSRQEAWNLTKIVVAVTVSMALLLGLLDYLFALELTGIIAKSAAAVGILVIASILSVIGVMLLNRD